MARDEGALRDAVERSAAVLAAAGFPKMASRVLMALTFADNGGMTAQELGDYLGASAAAISGAVRYLQSLGFVRRIAQPGSRRDRYEYPEDGWNSVMNAERPIYNVLATLAESALEAIGDPESVPGRRAAEMAQFYRFLETRIAELMQEWETVRKRL